MNTSIGTIAQQVAHDLDPENRLATRSSGERRSSADLTRLREDGIALALVLAPGDKPATAEEIAAVSVMIEQWYEPMSDEAFRVFSHQVQRRGWTRSQLEAALNRFFDRRYPKWTLGDFFGQPEPKLYPHSWYETRTLEDRRRVRAYKVEGHPRPLFGYVEEVGDALPEWEFPKVEPQLVLPGGTHDATHADDAEEPGPDPAERIRELEGEVGRLQAELASKEIRITDLGYEITEAKAAREEALLRASQLIYPTEKPYEVPCPHCSRTFEIQLHSELHNRPQKKRRS